MFDLSSRRFLDEAEHFAPRDGHRFVEIWSEGVSMHQGRKSTEQMEKQAHDASASQLTDRALFQAERKPAICQGELRERDVVAWALEVGLVVFVLPR
jgi:hypothetical protein